MPLLPIGHVSPPQFFLLVLDPQALKTTRDSPNINIRIPFFINQLIPYIILNQEPTKNIDTA